MHSAYYSLYTVYMYCIVLYTYIYIYLYIVQSALDKEKTVLCTMNSKKPNPKPLKEFYIFRIKWSLSRDFRPPVCSWFEPIYSRPLINRLKYFRIRFRFRRDIRILSSAVCIPPRSYTVTKVSANSVLLYSTECRSLQGTSV